MRILKYDRAVRKRTVAAPSSQMDSKMAEMGIPENAVFAAVPSAVEAISGLKTSQVAFAAEAGRRRSSGNRKQASVPTSRRMRLRRKKVVRRMTSRKKE